MGEIKVFEDISTTAIGQAAVANSMIKRISDRVIVEKFDGVQCIGVWKYHNKDYYNYKIFLKNKKTLLRFIHYTKKYLLLEFVHSTYCSPLLLYEESIMDVVKEELANYNKITGRDIPLSTHFVSSAGGSQMLKQIDALPNIGNHNIIESKVECLERLRSEKNELESRINQLEAELELENDSPELLTAVSK